MATNPPALLPHSACCGNCGAYNPPFKGQLVALAGNRAALARGCRYISEDFNRIWLPERLAALGSEAAAIQR